MRTHSIFLGVGVLAVGLALFSCGDQHDAVDVVEVPTQEILEVPPLRKSAEPGLKAPPAVVEPTAGPQGTFSEFSRLTADTLDRLPRVEDMRKSTGDNHFNPPELMAASPSLGKIATALRANPELIPQGIEFYHDCARREGTLTAVRVLCLRNLRFWAKEQPDVMDVDPRDYPEEMWKLADSLPPVVR